MTIHREGYKYITIATILWALISWINYHFLFQIPLLYWFIQIVFFLLWFWIVWFFRMPKRQLTYGENKVIAPADGKVVVIEEVLETEFFNDKRLQISVFMSPLNVHVNRNPVSGVVAYFKYHAGKYLVAWHPKSSTENERTTMVIAHPKAKLLVRQIAGALARRICYYVKEGDQAKQNEEFGFIRFGSRVDLFLPIGSKVNVNIGEKVQGGVTILAEL